MAIKEIANRNGSQPGITWHKIKIGEICKIKSGYAFDSKCFGIDGIPLIRIRDLKTNSPKIRYSGVYKKEYLIKKGAILVGMDGEFRCTKWNGPDALLNQRVCQIIADKKRVNESFLQYFINSYLKIIENETAFTTVKHISSKQILDIDFYLPNLLEQKRIVSILDKKNTAVEIAKIAAEKQLEDLLKLRHRVLSDSLMKCQKVVLKDCLNEVVKGIGSDWAKYPVFGATRQGLAPAKENVGKKPERYKPLISGTIFYNPMRINIGSIAMLGDDDPPGITSPDYVVIRTKEKILHPVWFYYWLRSHYGENLIKSLARGAVRERMLYKRLINGIIEIPEYREQEKAVKKFLEIDILVSRIREQINLIDLLPQAYLRQAFSGELL